VVNTAPVSLVLAYRRTSWYAQYASVTSYAVPVCPNQYAGAHTGRVLRPLARPRHPPRRSVGFDVNHLCSESLLSSSFVRLCVLEQYSPSLTDFSVTQ
jgi:hypothetical protein